MSKKTRRGPVSGHGGSAGPGHRAAAQDVRAKLAGGDGLCDDAKEALDVFEAGGCVGVPYNLDVRTEMDFVQYTVLSCFQDERRPNGIELARLRSFGRAQRAQDAPLPNVVGTVASTLNDAIIEMATTAARQEMAGQSTKEKSKIIIGWFGDAVIALAPEILNAVTDGWIGR